MAESLGGSRGKGGVSALGNSQASNMNASKREGGGMEMTQQGGIRGGSARAAGSPGGMGYNGSPARPNSAPRERPGMGAASRSFGSPAMDAKARVEEKRQVKEAGYWGRVTPIKRDVPAYWSLSTYGQPFSDPRLALGGASNMYQVLDPASKAKSTKYDVVGPATEQSAMLRKSLIEGKRLFNREGLTPIPDDGPDPEPLSQPDRTFILQQATPFQRIHALNNNLDRDIHSKDFKPWTEMVWDKLDAKFWRKNRALAHRMATDRLVNLMKRHLHYLVEQRCVAARAPASRPQDLLREEFWRVDPERTGLASLEQFLQVWQARLCLLEYEDVETPLVNGKGTRIVLKPGKRFILDENMAASLFVKYGLDKDGLMPYAVFIQALSAAPSRLLGQELVLDKRLGGRNGLYDDVDIGYCVGGAKILYSKCDTGVFPPSDFDSRTADRSRLAPKAHMWLEHVYGYAGHEITSSNVFYTCNTTADVTEVVYFTGAVGIVFNKKKWDAGQPSQRFFFGHDNDIMCIALHPNRLFVATGQQKATGPTNKPFVCIWELNKMNMLQKLDHDPKERAVLQVCFSGNTNAVTDEKKGGDLLVTITADDKHTVHVWKWMIPANKFCRAQSIPSWCFGPEKKMNDMYNAGLYYDNPEKQDTERPKPRKPGQPLSVVKYEKKAWAKWLKGEDMIREKAMQLDHPLLERLRDEDIAINPDWEEGWLHKLPDGASDKTFSMVEVGPGCNGTPPMVYGIVWNPLRPFDGRRGSEFATYGVKHLKTWVVNDQETWQGTSGSFGTDKIENVLSACYVPALHYMAAPGDSCLLTGFTSGQIGLWIPPFPTRAGATYQLSRKFDAHGQGVLHKLNDGTQVFGGVRVIKLRGDPTGKSTGRFICTGGADGYVAEWELGEVTGVRKDGTPLKGVNLKKVVKPNEMDEKGEPRQMRYCLDCANARYNPNNPCMVVALDTHPDKPTEYVAGTDDCDIWEVDDSPRVMIEGQEEDLWRLATHPFDPNIFATTSESGKVRVWDMRKYDLSCTAELGFPCIGITFSREEYGSASYEKSGLSKGYKNLHLAIGSEGENNNMNYGMHKIAILDATTLQPLKILKDPQGAVSELKYSPPGGPGILAAGSQDMTIYLYSCKDDYKLMAKCVGHSGWVEHIDWTLPISLPGTKLHGSMLIMSVDSSKNLLYWNPRTGRKVTANQRDAPMYEWTSRIGFDVMGIWPDDSNFDNISSVCASKRGAPSMDMDKLHQTDPKTGQLMDPAVCVMDPSEDDSADGVPGCGYLVTADDFSYVRLFNYPVVWDDAPHKMFRGHSSFVKWIRFSCDDRVVLSAGGHDRGIYQWRTLGINKDDMDGVEKDKLVLMCMEELLKMRREGVNQHQPKPGVAWGPLDEGGKVFGPMATLTMTDSLMPPTPGAKSLSESMGRFPSALGGSPTIMRSMLAKYGGQTMTKPPPSPGPDKGA